MLPYLHSMERDGLDTALIEAMVIDDELAAADAFLRTAIRLTNRMNFLGRDEYVLTALLAAGMERMLKLTLGFIRVDVDCTEWPTAELKSLGHKIVDLDVRCRELIKERVGEAIDEAEVAALATNLENDKYMPSVLALVQDYAQGGRYFNLDYLGQPNMPRASPRQQWGRLLAQVHQDGPHAGGPGYYPPSSSTALIGGISSAGGINWRLTASIVAWRNYYLTTWEHGVCGDRAQRLAQEIAWISPDSTPD